MEYVKNVPMGKFFHTMHSPRGANGSFVFGSADDGSGMMHNEAAMCSQEVFVGIKSGDILKCLPFFEKDESDGEIAYDFGVYRKPKKVTLRKFARDEISRKLGLATDTFSAPNLEFSVATPVMGIPDPDKSSAEDVKRSVMPAIPAKITVDNTKGADSVWGVFGLREMLGSYAISDSGRTDVEGAMDKKGTGFAFDTAQHGGRVQLIADFGPENVFNRHSPHYYRLDTMSGFIFEVKPGENITVDFMLGWFDEGIVTRGAHYFKNYYTRYFSTADEMFSYAVKQVNALWDEAYKYDKLLDESKLSEERKVMAAHAMHCYYASTMLFDDGGRARYVTNEGSYVMHNTFDLSVDHVFYEAMYCPWGIRSQLDSFAEEYSYYDTVHPYDDPDKHYPGGIAFTHDQGVQNTWSPKGSSAYEHINKHGCLSFMSHEELVNWIVCAGVYFNTTDDVEWITRRKGTICDCLTSLINRDHYDPAQRDGIMDLESDRCGISAEITTYDSIDPSLGQSRRNMYLAVKTWGAYLSIYRMINAMNDPLLKGYADEAMAGAKRGAATIVASFDEQLGYIPAILDGVDRTAIIPAIEGLIFPLWTGMPEMVAYDGPFAELLKTLKRHFINIMKPGVCIFSDGGWRMSASSINSWMSKIFLMQYINERILGVDLGETINREADVAHANWWTNIACRCPGVDQMFWGNIHGRGFHYPRAITAMLWLSNK